MKDVKKKAIIVDENERVEWLPVSRLFIDQRYQREIKQHRVEKWSAEFDPDSFGVLIVSRRKDGTLALIDGQHRRAVMLKLGWSEQSVPCYVIENLSPEKEAGLFHRYNSGVQPNAFEDFRALLMAQDPEAVAIEKIVMGANLQIGESLGSHGAGKIVAVGALRRVYQLGPSVLAQTLKTMVMCWGDTHDVLQSAPILGVGNFFAYHGEIVNQAELVRKLQRTQIGKLVREANELKAIMGGGLPSNFAAIMTKAYNRGRSTNNKLPNIDPTVSVHYLNKTAHTREKLKCEKCGAEYTRKSDLSKHKRSKGHQ